MLKKYKSINGITLVALVITIIILLILAGVSIAQLTGSGLFERAKEAKEKTDEAQELENTTLAQYEELINSNRENITLSKDQLEELINSKVEERTEITTLPTDGITFNETYIDKTRSTVDIQKSGNIVFLSFALGVKKDIPNSHTLLLSGIPKPTAGVVCVGRRSFTTGNTKDYNTVFAISKDSTDLYLNWIGSALETVNNTNGCQGTITYFTNE